jgi:hypothetical protein
MALPKAKCLRYEVSPSPQPDCKSKGNSLMMLEILTTVAPVLEAHAEHAHEGMGIIEEAWGLITDPGHALAEIFYNIVGDLVIVPITVFLYKKLREPKLRAAIHKEIDDEHGVTHEDCSGSTKGRNATDSASASSMQLTQEELDSMAS